MDIIEVLKALAHENRIRILNLLAEDELDDFADAQADLKRLEKYKNSSLSCEKLSDSDIFSD